MSPLLTDRQLIVILGTFCASHGFDQKLTEDYIDEQLSRLRERQAILVNLPVAPFDPDTYQWREEAETIRLPLMMEA